MRRRCLQISMKSCFKQLYARLIDETYRRKLICTLAVYGSYIMLGWTVSQTGVALPDLQKLVNVDLDTISWIFTLRSIGYVLGSLICGFVFDKTNRLGTMMVLTFGLAACSICLPFIHSLIPMLVVRLLAGIFGGGIATGANTIVATLWDAGGGQSFVQALYFTYTLGGIICPFITKPFMSDVANTQSPPTNTSDVVIGEGSADSKIWVAFLITGILLLLSSVSFLMMLLKGGYDVRRHVKKLENQHPSKHEITNVYTISMTRNVDENRNNNGTLTKPAVRMVDGFTSEHYSEDSSLSIGECQIPEDTNNLNTNNESITFDIEHTRTERKYLVLTFIIILCFAYSGGEDSFANFLLKFCLGYLNWTKDDAVLISSLYWTSSCVGGFLGIFVVRMLKSQTVLFATLISWNVAALLVIIGCIFRVNVLIWGGVGLSGASMVTVVPASISWTKEHVCEITGKISAAVKVASGTGYAGWTVSQVGVAIPDIQAFLNVDFDTVSWVFTMRSIGYAVGSLICGFIFDKTNRIATMVILSLGMAICSIGLPFISSFEGMLVVRLFTGIFGGGIATGTNTIIPTLWSADGGQSSVQALYFSYAVGGIVSPLITRPFMSDLGGLSNIHTGLSNKTLMSVMANISSTHTNRSTMAVIVEGSQGADIWVSFLITGILFLVSGCWFMIMLLQGGYDRPNYEEMQQDQPTSRPIQDDVFTVPIPNQAYTTTKMNASDNDTNIKAFKKYKHSELPMSVDYKSNVKLFSVHKTNIDMINYDCEKQKIDSGKNPDNSEKAVPVDADDVTIEIVHKTTERKVLVLTFIVILCFSYSGAEDTIGNFLLKFCIGYLNWTTDDAVLITSVYWTSSCIGGFLGVFIVRAFKPQTVIFASLVVWNISSMVVIAGCLFRFNALIWGGIVVSGASMVLVVPTAISWTKENICEITGKISSVIKVATGTGYAVSPIIIGYLMEKVTYMSFKYLLMGQSVLCLVCFIVASRICRL